MTGLDITDCWNLIFEKQVNRQKRCRRDSAAGNIRKASFLYLGMEMT